LLNQLLLQLPKAVCIAIGTCHETLSFVPRLTACFFSGLFTSRFREAGLRIPFDRPFDFTQGHEQRRMAQGCGFPHTQAAKRTAPSDSAELVAGRPSLKKEFHGRACQQNPHWTHMRKYQHKLLGYKKEIHIPWDSRVTGLKP
jgi:hypothetical protein